MSWRIDVTGTKSGVAKKVTEQLDKIGASFEGKEEAKDVLIAKERILAIVAAVDLTADESTEWNAVHVQASGLQISNAKGIVKAQTVISIERTHLMLD